MEERIPQTIPELYLYLRDTIEQKLNHHEELFMVIQDELHKNTVRVGALERALLR